MTFKYVMFSQADTAMDVPVLAALFVPHNEILLINSKPISAGFCDIVNDRVLCYGESINLGLQSRGEEDALMIRAFSTKIGGNSDAHNPKPA